MAYYVARLVGLLVLFTGVGPVVAQSVRATGATVSNIRVEADSQRVKIRYDVVGISPADSVHIQIESRSAGNLPVRTVTGDVGKGVAPGTDKTIYWDYRLDGVSLIDDIRATVLIKQATTRQSGAGNGGATYALVSALVPGVGNIFVQPNRHVGVRPLITVAYAGLLAYGLIQQGQSKKHYALYESGLNESDYTTANRLHHQYLVAVRTAAVVWLADVVYTFVRGTKNDRARISATANRRLFVDVVHTTPTVGLRLRF